MARRSWIALAVAAGTLLAACGGDDSGSGDTTPDTTPDTAPDSGAPSTDGPDASTPAGMTGAIDLDAVLGVDLADCAEPTGGPLKIGYAADKSEAGGFADIPASAAAEFFVELVNCAGGVDGAKVELIVEDIQGDPEVTQRAAQDLIGQGVHGILGPPFADFGQPLLQVTAGEVPVVFVASTEPALADPGALSYLASFDDTAQAEAAAQFAIDQGWTTAITLSAPGPYFGYVPETFTAAFEGLGGTILGDYTYVPFEDTDFSAQANEISNLDETPQLLFTAAPGFQVTALRAQLEALGVELTYLGADAFEATGLIAEGDAANGMFYTTHAFAEPDNHLGRFLALYEEATGSPAENPSFAGLAADSIMVIAQAFVDSGSTDPKVIGEAIANISGLTTMTGTTTYAGTGGVPDKPVFIHQIVDGEVTLAATIEG